MEKLDKFYEKINGSYCGIIAVLIAAISVIVAQLLYLAVDPTFSMTTNYISHLGAGPNGSDIVFNVGNILSGIFYLPFYVYIGWYLQKKSNSISFIKKGMVAGFIVAIARILIGVFPVSSENNMHALIAIILFYAASIMLMIYGISEYQNPDIPIIITVLSFITAILYGAFITIALIESFASIPHQTHTFLIEWLAFYLGLVWAIAHIYYTLKHK